MKSVRSPSSVYFRACLWPTDPFPALCPDAWLRDLQSWGSIPTLPSAGNEAQSQANLASNPGSATFWLCAIEEITSL